MKRKILAVVMIAVLTLGVFAGCSAKQNAAASEPQYWADEEMAYGGMYDNKNTMDMPAEPSMTADYDAAEAPEAEEAGAPVNMVNNLTYGENVKLIFRAWMRLQTLDFAQAESELNKLVEQYGGYFESVYTDNGSYYSTYSHLTGSYTVRVPAQNYDRFLSAVGNTCHVVNLNKTTEDIGLQYSDTQMRLETVKAKQERLLALLKQATEMSDIIELESAISDCQYEIDSLTSTINRYDSLIGFSTVNIELEQVERLGNAITEEETFWTKLARDLSSRLSASAMVLKDAARCAASSEPFTSSTRASKAPRVKAATAVPILLMGLSSRRAMTKDSAAPRGSASTLASTA